MADNSSGAEDDKLARHRALLRKSFDALEAEQEAEEPEPEPTKRRRRKDRPPEDDVVMYRGRPVRKGRGLATPGAGNTAQRGRQFRGAAIPSKGGDRQSGGAGRRGGDDIKAALQKLKDLHREGLITNAEFERKKRQLLDRL